MDLGWNWKDCDNPTMGNVTVIITKTEYYPVCCSRSNIDSCDNCGGENILELYLKTKLLMLYIIQV